MRTRFCSFMLLLVLLVLVVTACNSAPVKPTVVLNSPPHGSQFREGEDVSFQSTATDAKGVTRVELLIDGATVRSDAPPNAQGQTSFSLIQTWKATQGTHTVSVRAFNTSNVVSDPAVISITISAAAAVPTAIPVVSQPTTATVTPTTAPPPPASSSSSSAAPACTNNSAFVADVTVPDGTAFVANQAFNKIWRIKNTGSCNWGGGYLFVFASGELMATTTSIAVPNTAPGATVDLLIPMTAPAPLGQHSGTWRLKGPSGALFGTTLSVVINVIDTSAPAGPTNTPVPQGNTDNPPPATGCQGAPAITSFTSDKTSLLPSGGSVTLSWGAVTNADTVEIDGGVGGVGTPGSITLNVTPPKTFTLTAKCGSTTATRQVSISKASILLPITPIPYFPLFAVTDVGISASTSGMVLCGSKTYTFTGSVTANGTGDAQYRWEKNGSSVQSGSVHFAGSGTLAVAPYTFKPNGIDHSGSVRLHVTSPGDKSSPSMSYSCIY